MGGSTWRYTGISHTDWTGVGEGPYGGSTLNLTSSSWFDASGWTNSYDLLLPYGDLVFSGGYPVYAVGLQLRWFDMSTGRQVGQYWNPFISNLDGFDLNGREDDRFYCDFRASQPL